MRANTSRRVTSKTSIHGSIDTKHFKKINRDKYREWTETIEIRNVKLLIVDPAAVAIIMAYYGR